MGGKSSAIVLEGCELEKTARALISSAMRATGQKPGAIARVFVEKTISATLIELLNTNIQQINIGYPAKEGVYLGPMISEHWRSRYRKFGKLLADGTHTTVQAAANYEIEDYKGFYVQPSLFKMDPSAEDLLLDTEPPGPILMIYEVEDIAQAIQLNNQISYQKSTSIFCDPESNQLEDLPSKLKTGTLFINQAPLELANPICAHGKSSNGKAGGIALLENLSQKKFLFWPRKT